MSSCSKHKAVFTYKISEKAGLYAWAGSRDTLRDRIKLKRDKNESGVTAEQIRDIIESDSRLTCISISDPYTIKELVVDLTSDYLHRRKRQFQVRPYILFVFDEGQEFVRDLTNAIISENPQLRYTVGNDATTLLQAKRTMSDAEFGDLIKQQFLS